MSREKVKTQGAKQTEQERKKREEQAGAKRRIGDGEEFAEKIRIRSEERTE